LETVEKRRASGFVLRSGVMRTSLFWLSDEQWERIEPHLPTDVRGVARVDDRRVISGIVHVLKSGCHWCDCPPEYGRSTTIYNRFVRWARRGIWEDLFRQLAGNGRSTDAQMADPAQVTARRLGAGGKGGRKSRLWALRVAAAARRSMHSQMVRGALSPSCGPEENNRKQLFSSTGASASSASASRSCLTG
jgi:transposase